MGDILGSRRSFNGRTYEVKATYDSKRKAVKRAKQFRANFSPARVVPSKKYGYILYVSEG